MQPFSLPSKVGTRQPFHKGKPAKARHLVNGLFVHSLVNKTGRSPLWVSQATRFSIVSEPKSKA